MKAGENPAGPCAHVVVVGSINADLQMRVERLAAPGETLLARGGELWPGGKGANQAVAAAKLGAKVTMVGAIGTDGRAVEAISGLADAGVDRSRVAVVPGQTGLAVICINEQGENSIYVLPGANATVTAAQVRLAADVIGDADVVLVQGEIPKEATEEAIRLAEQSGVRTVVNLAPAGPLDPNLVHMANPLVVNEHEAAEVLRRLSPENPAALAVADCSVPDCEHPLCDVVECRDPVQRGQVWATRLVEDGVRSVVVTLGGAGAVVSTPGPDRHPVTTYLPVPQVEQVDTTGAGDAFVGALTTGIATEGDLVTAARLASRAAAFSVCSHGTQGSYASVGDELPE